MTCWAFLGLPQLLGVSIGAEKTERKGRVGQSSGKLGLIPALSALSHIRDGHMVQGLLLNCPAPPQVPGTGYLEGICAFV